MGNEKKFETMLIHEGYYPKTFHDSLTPPIYHTSTYAFANAQEGEKRFSGETDGYIYSRLGNPTVQILEDRICQLENGEGAIAFGSGMAAVSAILFHIVKSGSHVLCSRGIYGCTFGLLDFLNEKFDVSYTFSSLKTAEEIENAIQKNTSCIYVETPINPTMELIDIELVTSIAKKHGIPVVVDNTFCSPYLQNPLNLGANYVIHSATKYISGHGDVIAGLVIGNRKDDMDKLRLSVRKDIGGIMSPFDAWLLLRGLKTLHVRMDRHVKNTRMLVDYLKDHNQIEQIFYPGDPASRDFHIAQKQMKAPGGMVSFTIKGEKKEAQQFMNRLKLIKISVSLGDAETLIQHPATMTHAVVPREERERMGITENMLRLSVGLEAVEDLIDDLKQALS